MNRFVRNNLFLIIACVAAGVAAVGLLVFSIIRYTEMARCIAEIEQFRQQIIQLGKKVPAPVDENKPLIKQDIQLYTRLAGELEAYFTSGTRASAGPLRSPFLPRAVRVDQPAGRHLASGGRARPVDQPAGPHLASGARARPVHQPALSRLVSFRSALWSMCPPGSSWPRWTEPPDGPAL